MDANNHPIRITKLAACAGCAAKLNPLLLREALSGLPKQSHANLLVGADTMDDAGVYKINDETAIITTTDFFTPIVDDPELFGEIAAANAMSDVYAMGGEVVTVLNILSFPKTLPIEFLHKILKGASRKVAEAEALVVGGHTIATETLIFGLAVTGVIHPRHLTSNDQAKVGDQLILTKPIGTGIITTAIRADKLQLAAGEEAFHVMTSLNRKAAKLMTKYRVGAATDITGFGVLGHAGQMALASSVTFKLQMTDVPVMERVFELANDGIVTGAEKTNREYTLSMCRFDTKPDKSRYSMLLDPQTSGGLLMCVKPHQVKALLDELRSAGYERSSVVGQVIAKEDRPLIIE